MAHVLSETRTNPGPPGTRLGSKPAIRRLLTFPHLIVFLPVRSLMNILGVALLKLADCKDTRYGHRDCVSDS